MGTTLQYIVNLELQSMYCLELLHTQLFSKISEGSFHKIFHF